MTQSTMQQVLEKTGGSLTVSGDAVRVADTAHLRNTAIDQLIRLAIFGSDAQKAVARWLIWEAALDLGIYATSINDLYLARGTGKTRADFTVPAMNLRAIPYHMACAALRAARPLNAGAMIFEIARSEMGYTDQRPAEYVTNILAAAIKTGYEGPVYIQGDHFQVSHSRYKTDAEAEVNAVKELAADAIAAGFYNIDIDTSTLVDLSQESLEDQQQLNAALCADISAYIRGIEPDGITVSLGGEIGEVGEKNSTVPELEAFMSLYNAELAKLGDHTGISKISVQTGTSHGGVVLPDGSIADVAVDFETLKRLSKVSREKYHLAGAVQHGASTLPEDAFNKFAEAGACEIHLATGFQNIMYEHEAFPSDLRDEIYAWLDDNYERKDRTDEQFYYEERKRAIGQFKQELWDMGDEVIQTICAALQDKFHRLFDKLNIADTHPLAVEHTRPVHIRKQLSDFGIEDVVQEDVSDLAD